MTRRAADVPHIELLGKASTGIPGLDAITHGGLPRGRTTLVCGGPGCGKTLLGLQFLVSGAVDHGEPGVMMAFEESPSALRVNAASFGWDLDDLSARDLLIVDSVRLPSAEIEETDGWNLDGLLVRLSSAVDAIGAKRVVLDTVETLFSALRDESLLRAELQRLFGWLSDHELTAVVTGERGRHMLTQHGLEEYVSDCVISLDHRVNDQISTRRLRVVKYRGSAHGADEYPFSLEREGFVVWPVTSMALEHAVKSRRVSTGVAELDTMLAGGVYEATSILVTGTPGAGKTGLAAEFMSASCRRGERCLMFAFEESPQQIVRNTASTGCHLDAWIDAGLLKIVSRRPGVSGLEAHLAQLHAETDRFQPRHVVLDPLSALDGEEYALNATLGRLIDYFKTSGITAWMTALVGTDAEGAQGLGISSIMDTAIHLGNHAAGGERNRTINVVKSRGSAHSNQLREFELTSGGIVICDPFPGANVLMGTARKVQEAEHLARARRSADELEARAREWRRRESLLRAQMASLAAELEAGESDLAAALSCADRDAEQAAGDQAALVVARTEADAFAVDRAEV